MRYFPTEWSRLGHHYKLMPINQKTDGHLCNGLFTRTLWVSRHQKGQTKLDFNKERNDGVAVESAAPYASHFHLAPGQIMMPACRHSNFYRPDALRDAQLTAQSTEGN